MKRVVLIGCVKFSECVLQEVIDKNLCNLVGVCTRTQSSINSDAHNLIPTCKQNNIEYSETNFTFEDINNCNEAFVTGTFAGIIPVSKLESRKLKSTNPDSLVNQIRALYNQEIQEYIG